MISLYDAVPDPGFADDRYTCLRERSNIAIDGADTRLEFIGNIFGPSYSASLQMDEDRDESIDTVHGSYFTQDFG